MKSRHLHDPARLAIAASALLHLGVTAWAIGLRWEHLAGNGLWVAIAFSGRRGRQLALLLLPMWLAGVAYEYFKFLEIYRGSIRVSELYELEQRWFGIETADGLRIPAELLAERTNATLDFVTGLAYIIYLWVPIAMAFVLYFIDPVRMSRLTWSLFLVSLMGMATYLAYPAAPPWYVADYGLGPADPAALPSAAGAARFDALTGWDYFAGFYSRSANVFGAMPSLHVSFPLIVVGAVWGMGPRWTLSTFGFTVLVAFSAIYLQHHYLADVVAGFLYGVAASVIVARFHGQPVVVGETTLLRRRRLRGRPQQSKA